MNATLSVQELWSQIRMLPAGERHWLANKLYDYMPVLTGRVPISRQAASVPRKKSDV